MFCTGKPASFFIATVKSSGDRDPKRGFFPLKAIVNSFEGSAAKVGSVLMSWIVLA